MSNASANTLLPVLRRLAETDADRPALTCGDVTLTRAGFVERIERLAVLFGARGVVEGSTVTIALPNSAGFAESSLINYFEPADRGRVSIHIEKKRKRRTSRGAFAKLTTMAHGRPRITEEPPVRVTISDDEQADLVDHLLAGYRLTLQEDRRSLFDRFTEVDVVRQVVGVGSVGMQVYLVLLEGRTGADPLFLQVKQAGPSVYEAHTQPSRHDSHGARVTNGKRLVQSTTDIFVGWGSLHGKDYYVRQFRDMKIIPTTDLIAPRLAEFATACGETLARAHARTGDPVAIDGYIGNGPKFAAAIRRFARLYADQNERDHAQLVSAIAAGAVESLPG